MEVDETSVPQCPLCHRQFVSSSMLNRHLKEGNCLDSNHNDDVTCKNCLQSFENIDNLNNHVCDARKIKMEEDDNEFLETDHLNGIFN